MSERGNSPKHFSTHDFLRLGDEEAFISSVAQEEWVQEILTQTQTIVVRRGPRPGVLIPVGVRGRISSQRCGGFISPSAVIERIRPEQLVERRIWQSRPNREEIRALRHLEAITHALAPFQIAWGPVGSIGFELMSGLPVSEMDRDLDLMIRAEQRISIDLACQLMKAVESPEIRVDLYLETPAGGLALDEYLRQAPKMLVHTDSGPKLVQDPWGSES